MNTAEITCVNGVQTVTLPADIRIDADRVSVRREGQAVVLEPVKAGNWPPGFFDSIHIDDPAFARPVQGQVPPAPSME